MKLEMKSEWVPPRRPPRSALNTSSQFKLVKGCNECIVGPLIICQLHVSGPDHHHHVRPSLLSCFGLCDDKSRIEERGLVSCCAVLIGSFPCFTFLLTSSDVGQEHDFLRLTANPLSDSLIAFTFYFSSYGCVEVTIK